MQGNEEMKMNSHSLLQQRVAVLNQGTLSSHSKWKLFKAELKYIFSKKRRQLNPLKDILNNNYYCTKISLHNK